MNFRDKFMSAFIKQCPHCNNPINAYALRKEPKKKCHWYEQDPTVHYICPFCNGSLLRTHFTRWYAAAFLLSGLILPFSQLWLELATLLYSELGLFTIFVTIFVMSWLNIKSSVLICKPSNVESSKINR